MSSGIIGNLMFPVTEDIPCIFDLQLFQNIPESAEGTSFMDRTAKHFLFHRISGPDEFFHDPLIIKVPLFRYPDEIINFEFPHFNAV
jgi:hypothetical protein